MTSKLPSAKHNLSIINTPTRPYLTWLKDGIKKAEGRVNGPAYQKMKVGDSIVLHSREQYIHGIISFKHEYKTFEEMLQNEGITNMLPFLTNHDMAAAVDVYNNFPGAERVKKFGCVAIGIDVMKFELFRFTSE